MPEFLEKAERAAESNDAGARVLGVGVTPVRVSLVVELLTLDIVGVGTWNHLCDDTDSKLPSMGIAAGTYNLVACYDVKKGKPENCVAQSTYGISIFNQKCSSAGNTAATLQTLHL